MSLLGQLPTGAVDTLQFDKQRKPFLSGIVTGWQNFFNAVQMICNALTQSGTTAQRPMNNLWIGRTFFDKTLGFQICYNGTAWVNSAGTPV